MAGRFYEDTSLDRATRLKEVQRRRAALLAELDERDKQRAVTSEENAASSSFSNLLLEPQDSEVVAVEKHALLPADTNQAVVQASQTSPRAWSPRFRQRSNVANGVAGTQLPGSPKRPTGAHPKENRQAANERAIDVYSASGIGSPRRRSPRRAESAAAGGSGSIWNVRRLLSMEGRRATAPPPRRRYRRSPNLPERRGEQKV